MKFLGAVEEEMSPAVSVDSLLGGDEFAFSEFVGRSSCLRL